VGIEWGRDQQVDSQACAGGTQYSTITLGRFAVRHQLYGDMRVGEIRQFCKLQDEGQSLMWAAMTQLNLSARAYHRFLKLSRTIADLAGSEDIQSAHLAEALQYRPKLMIG